MSDTAYNISICDAVLGRELFQPQAFQASSKVLATNHLAIRFGASNNMMTLLEGTSEQKEKYIRGLVATSLVMAFFFVLWSIIILIFRCTGYRRCGFLCGRFIRPKMPLSKAGGSSNYTNSSKNGYGEIQTHSTFQMTNEYPLSTTQPPPQDIRSQSSENQKLPEQQSQKSELFSDHHNREMKLNRAEEVDADERWREACRKQEVRAFRTRLALLFSCLGLSVAAILFCVYGTIYVQKTLDVVFDQLRLVQSKVLSVIGRVQDVVDNEVSIAKQTMNDLQTTYNTGFCPLKRSQLCESLSPVVQNCSFSGIPGVQEPLTTIFNVLYIAKSYVFPELPKLQQGLLQAQKYVEDVLPAQPQLEGVFWASFAFTLSLVVCCLIIVLGIYQAHRGQLGRCGKIRNQIVFPIFSIFVVVAFVLAITFTLLSIGSSDWCIDSPNPKVTYILNRTEGLASIAADFAKFYVNSCPKDSEPIYIYGQFTNLVTERQPLATYANAIQNIPADEWTNTCGSDIAVARQFGNQTTAVLCRLSAVTSRLGRFLWCSEWNPLYTTLMYQAFCSELQTALTWISATMFAIVFFAFVILLLRAGAFDIEDEEVFLEDSRKCRMCCYRTVTCTCCVRQTIEPPFSSARGQSAAKNTFDNKSAGMETTSWGEGHAVPAEVVIVDLDVL